MRPLKSLQTGRLQSWFSMATMTWCAVSGKWISACYSKAPGRWKKLIVIPENNTGKYADLINVFEDEGFIPVKENEINDENIPEDMDMSDEIYRNRLKEVFDQHGNQGFTNFNYFYQSPDAMDEIMAHSIPETEPGLPHGRTCRLRHISNMQRRLIRGVCKIRKLRPQ